jgi:IclR family KDG regulon transcriptional repressor
MTVQKKDYLLSSVTNALRILRSFSMEEPEKKVKDLASSLNISKSAVSRLMSTLASQGFVEKKPGTQDYRLGLSVLSLSSIVTSSLDLHKEAPPVLAQLVKDTGETAHIAVLDNSEVVYIHKEDSKHPIRIYTFVGNRNPAYCTSTGKTLLAYLNEATAEEIINKGLTSYTTNTIIDPNVLKEELRQIREQGYATSNEEYRNGVAAIAAPIRDYTGKVISAISIVGRTEHIQNQNISSNIKKVKRAAREISSRLGYWK